MKHAKTHYLKTPQAPSTKALVDALMALSVGETMIARIDDNARLYQAHIGDYQQSPTHQSLFLFFYFVLIWHWQAGHTLFYIHDDGRQDWQRAVLEPVWQVIGTAFVDFDGVSLSDDFVLAYQAGQSKVFVERVVDDISQKAQRMGLAKVHAEQLGKLLRLTLRVYYWLLSDGSVAVFYQRLRQCVFFCCLTTPSDSQNDNKKSPLVLTPLSDTGFGLWLYRTWQAEFWLACHLLSLTHAKPSQTDYPTPDLAKLNDAQRQAVAGALRHDFAIITGGPGTGKTFTVAQLVLLLMQADNPPTLALTAPTGKAAKRMQASLQHALQGANAVDLPEPKTIHRLLGLGFDGKPRHHKQNPLSEDVIIVDEASMLGVELTCLLCAAIKKGAKLILLGDIHQLAAVEAGAVLRDLCQVAFLSPYHCQLTQSRRFDETSGVGRLAALVNRHDNSPSQALLTALDEIVQSDYRLSRHHLPKHKDKVLLQGLYTSLLTDFVPYFEQCFNALKQHKIHKQAYDIDELFLLFNRYRLLSASHLGDFGDDKLNEQAILAHLANYHTQNRQMTRPLFIKKQQAWYHGRAVMMTKNSYDLGLFNGDIGICVQQNDELLVYFEGQMLGVPVSLLKDETITNAYAMTVHKSQGSEFERVAICLENDSERLLGRELLYTAITRAKHSVSLYADDEALVWAMSRPTVRQTGLAWLFDELQKAFEPQETFG